MTVGAGDLLLNLELLLHALVDLLQSEANTCSEVGATLYLTATATTSEATEIKATEATTSEEVSKATEDILHGHPCSAETTTASSTAADTSVTELVIALTLLRIAQHVIGLSQFLELLFGFLVPRVLIGVILDSELAIGLLQFVSRSTFSYAEDFVVISLFCHRLFLLSLLSYDDGGVT